ncbi:MAG: class I tRNA ligase family protein, partial [Clostridia bacterium]|nr:class I tRNA ligase family protein [Clostridia bacterium]
QTNAMLIGDLLFDEAGILDAYQQLVLPFWNACNFFISYANIDGFEPKQGLPKSDNQLDRWVLAKLEATEKTITENMNGYRVNRYVDALASMVDGLTNWYIRRSRKRFWASGYSADKAAAYDTLYYVLVNLTKLFAPVAPIIAEKIYRNLTGEESVHLAAWPKVPETYRDDELVERVDLVQRLISLARSIRQKNRIKNRQPLRTLKIALSDAAKYDAIKPFADVIAEEMNVKEVRFIERVDDIASVGYDPNFNEIRALYPDKLPAVIKAVKTGAFTLHGETVTVKLDGGDEELDAKIILVKYTAKDGAFIASEAGMVVSLDLTIDEDLRDEGLAREIVRNVQDARKSAGCAITDRVVLAVKDGKLPEKWVAFILGETLAEIGEVASPVATVEIEDEGVTLLLGKKN